MRKESIVDQHYDFEYDLGQWTYGTISVYKSRDSEKLRTCKTIPKSLVRPSGHAVEQLKALKHLQHPSICTVTDCMEDNKNYYVFAEFAQGGELSDWCERIDERYTIQEQTCAAYIRQAIIALVHAHASNTFHGALLPSSLSLSSKLPDATVRVSDFGLASILDSDQRVLQRNRSPYTAPEILSGEFSYIDGACDMYSIGAIAHAMLVGRAPKVSAETSGFLSRLRGGGDQDLKAAWAERSSLSYDFVQQMLKPWDERLTPARALQHPWLKGLQPIGGVLSDASADKDLRMKTLCYMLAVLLVPTSLPYRDFDQLRASFVKNDSDRDGFISRLHAKRILGSRCKLPEAVDAALSIVDISSSDIFDLCAVACADVVAREFFAAGPTGQELSGPFGSKDLAPRMLKKFFDAFGGRQQAVTLSGLRARLRTATANEVEAYARVSYEEILSEFPDEGKIDAQMLTTLLASNAGHGTPLGNGYETTDEGWTMARASKGFGLMSLFSQCMAPGGAGHEDDTF